MSIAPIEFPAQELWQRLDPAGPFKEDWLRFRHRQQGEFLHDLAKYAPFDLGLSHIGNSNEGRVLHTLRFGRGKRRVLLWARQHGDEPDCSAGLAMALCELVLRSEEPAWAMILDRLELGVFPMVNPDGVTRFTRRNAEGIDINRDGVAQATQEGRALMKIREAFEPEFCFNLHDMSPRKSTAKGELVALAFQAAPFGPGDVDNPARLGAKTVIAHMADAVRPHAPNNIARYTADYMHRAFGDSMMRLGVGSILVEAGGWPAAEGGDGFVRRLFALAVLRGLHAIAAGEDDQANGAAYNAIPLDAGRKFNDVVLHGGHVLSGSGRPPFRADLALNAVTTAGFPHDPIVTTATVDNIGDLEDELALERIDLAGSLVLPGLMAVAPALQFDRRLPSPEEAMPFLNAGITTVACGFGPFESARTRDAWLEQARTHTPPLNIVAFERMPSLRDIRGRHGLTDFAGMLVQDLMIAPEDLLNFTHLYHPAHHSAIEGDHSGKMIGIDLFFQMGASPADTHLHLHLTHIDGSTGHAPVRAEDLRALVDEFLRDPSQVTLSQDSIGGGFPWLPIMIGFGGLSNGRLPAPQFFGRILQANRMEDPSGLVGSLNLLTLNNARAFRLRNLGRIEISQRADLAAFEESMFRDPTLAATAHPHLVMLNGRVVVNHAEGANVEPPQGAWFLASRLQVR